MLKALIHSTLRMPLNGLGFLVGIALAFLVPQSTIAAGVISEIFMNLLRLISLPMIFFAIVSTIIQMESLVEAKRLLLRTLRYTILTTILAATIAFGLFAIFQPSAPHLIGEAPIAQAVSWSSYLMKAIPSNPIQPFIEGNVIGIAVMGAIFSAAISLLPSKQKGVLTPIFGALFDSLLKVAGGIIKLLPIAIVAFTIIGVDQLRTNFEGIRSILLYISMIIGANLIQGFIVLPILLKSKGISPIKHFKNMLPALSMAFFSKSSNATLPLTLKCARDAGISEKTSSFTLPLCSIINMNGCAAFIYITTLFVAKSAGIHFTGLEMVGWIFLATFAAVGNAGVPMGCFFLTTSFLIGMNVPLKMMGIILPLYAVFDMIETALNVYSDSCIAAIVDQEQ